MKLGFVSTLPTNLLKVAAMCPPNLNDGGDERVWGDKLRRDISVKEAYMEIEKQN